MCSTYRGTNEIKSHATVYLLIDSRIVLSGDARRYWDKKLVQGNGKWLHSCAVSGQQLLLMLPQLYQIMLHKQNSGLESPRLFASKCHHVHVWSLVLLLKWLIVPQPIKEISTKDFFGKVWNPLKLRRSRIDLLMYCLVPQCQDTYQNPVFL